MEHHIVIQSKSVSAGPLKHGPQTGTEHGTNTYNKGW